MSVLIAQSERGKGVQLSLRRTTVDEYHRMIDDGYFAENERFELINGWIIEKMPKNPPHSSVNTRMRQVLEDQLPRNQFTVRTQEPITLENSEPEPDVVVARGTLDDYTERHPGPSDVLLVVEVADSTLDMDQGPKLEVYATAGLDPYVILDIQNRAVLIYRNPRDGSYPAPHVVRDSEEIVLQLDQATIRFTPESVFKGIR